MPEETVETVETTESVNEAADILLSQGLEEPTEAELRGDDLGEETEDTTEAKTEEAEETKTEEKEEAGDETVTEEETKATEEKPANSEPQAKETPKGFVPLAAVHEARGEIKYLKEQIQTLSSQMTTLQTQKPAEVEVEDTFEVLTDDQFEDLADDNPAQAAIYLRKLNVHEAKQREAADRAIDEANFQRDYDEIIDNSVAEIEKVVPGIFDEDSEVGTELMEFANDLGFTEDLYYLTNPSTKVILPGDSEPLLLGEQAASILSMLVNAKGKTVAPDTTELEAKLRTEITAELMKKFKNPDTEEFRGLSQVPKTDGDAPEPSSFEGKVLTTKQLEKLTDAEQEAYLAGN